MFDAFALPTDFLFIEVFNCLSSIVKKSETADICTKEVSSFYSNYAVTCGALLPSFLKSSAVEEAVLSSTLLKGSTIGSLLGSSL